jgi:erythromycin esterase
MDSHLPSTVPSPKVPVEGRVVAPTGAAVEGALVALIAVDQFEARELVASEADGSFRFSTEPGRYALTATAADWVGTYELLVVASDMASLEPVVLKLDPTTEGVTFTGQVQNADAPPVREEALRIVGKRGLGGDIFYVRTREDGTFVVHLPRAARYRFILDRPIPIVRPVAGDASATVRLTEVAPPPQAVIDWVKEHARPLLTTEAGNGFVDLEAIASSIGDARVVALGEATHGTREFFQMKHRFFEYLVSKMGFTVFAIEANYPEALKVDNYVLHGEGDAADALAGMHFWTWNTEEVLDLIEWMRAYNADPNHEKKLRFYGFDMQFSRPTAEIVREYLERTDPEYMTEIGPTLSLLTEREMASLHRTLTEAEYHLAQVSLSALYDRFEERKRGPLSNLHTWTVMRQHVRVLQQSLDLHQAHDPWMRDRAMAENVRWILDNESPGTRIMLWAHNNHVQRTPYRSRGLWESASQSPTRSETMGTHLARDLGDAYRCIGFLFGHGSFQAYSMRGAKSCLEEHEIGPPPAGTAEAVFASLDAPLLFFDMSNLRMARGGPVADWFAKSPPTREIGAAFQNEAATLNLGGRPLCDRFDSLIYVDKTTRARPVVRMKRLEKK